MKKFDLSFAFAKIAMDFGMIFLSLMLAYFLRMSWFEIFDLSAPTTLLGVEAFSFFSIKITLFLILILGLNNRYEIEGDEKFFDETRHLFWQYSAGFGLILVVFFFTQFSFFSRFILGMAWVLGMVLLLLGRGTLRGLKSYLHHLGYGRTRLLILGSNALAESMILDLSHDDKFEIVGTLTDKKTTKKKLGVSKILGAFSDLEKILKKEAVDEILLASENSSQSISEKLIKVSQKNHVKFRFLPDELSLDLATVEVSTLKGRPIFTFLNSKLRGWSLVIKSLFDQMFALLALILLLPIFGIVALLIWRENKKAPIFYQSKRVGKNAQEFFCFKFRTMVPEADKQKGQLLSKNERTDGVLFKMENDPRVTKIGKFLRTWSIDEWPQFLNVLRGEMSLIGPRPHLPDEVKKYPKEALQILSAKPGMTGFSAINGRSKLTFEEEMNFEIFYLKNWSLLLDALIFLKSIWIVLKRENVS